MLAGKNSNKAITAYEKYRTNNNLKNNSYDFKINNTAVISNQNRFHVDFKSVKHHIEIPK